MKHLLFGAAIILAACAPENPVRQPPAEKFEKLEVQSKGFETRAENLVDIVFVMDDSQSMKVHQDRMSQAIGSFLSEFQGNALMNYHIGVTSAYDPRLATYLRYRPDLKNRELDMVGFGELLPFKPATGSDAKLRYVTRDTEGVLELLENTLKVGAKPGPDQKSATTLGPWFEVFFSQIQGIFSEPALTGVNQGFHRGKDSTLVILLITDANDESPDGNAKSFKDFLVNLKGGDINKVQPFAAIIPSGTNCVDKEGRPIARDSSGEPKKIEAFLDSFPHRAERVLNLCSDDFGGKLAQFGKFITQSLPEKVIEIPGNAEFGVQVYYGDTLLEIGKHYYFESGIRPDEPPKNDRIVLRRELEVQFQKDATIKVKYIPLKTENIGKKHKTQII